LNPAFFAIKNLCQYEKNIRAFPNALLPAGYLFGALEGADAKTFATYPFGD
jgi:hypothetical protein